MNFTSLVNAAPFDPETKKEIIDKAGSLSADQRIRLTKLAWRLIRYDYEKDANEKIDEEMKAVREGKKKYDKDFVSKLEKDYLNKLSARLASSDDSEELRRIRTELSLHQEKKQLSSHAA